MKTDKNGDQVRRLLSADPNTRLKRIADRGGQTGKMARYAASGKWGKGKKTGTL